MHLRATIEYLDTADVYGKVDGVISLTDSKPAIGTVYVWIPPAEGEEGEGKPGEYDLLAEAVVDEHTDGTIRVTAKSCKAEVDFGVENSTVRLRVTPK